MLILTRHVGETLIIGHERIKFTVLGIKQNQVKIGITAPKSVPVDREEIFLKKQIQKANEAKGNNNGNTNNKR